LCTNNTILITEITHSSENDDIPQIIAALHATLFTEPNLVIIYDSERVEK